MGRKDKLLARLQSIPKDFTFDELKTLLESFGYSIISKGKTGGSRTRFQKGKKSIVIHKPHPHKEFYEYQVRQILKSLEKEGLI